MCSCGKVRGPRVRNPSISLSPLQCALAMFKLERLQHGCKICVESSLDLCTSCPGCKCILSANLWEYTAYFAEFCPTRNLQKITLWVWAACATKVTLKGWGYRRAKISCFPYPALHLLHLFLLSCCIFFHLAPTSLFLPFMPSCTPPVMPHPASSSVREPQNPSSLSSWPKLWFMYLQHIPD